MSLVDLAPTLAGLLGKPFLRGGPLDGRDLSQALARGRRAGGRRALRRDPLPGDLRLEPARRPAPARPQVHLGAPAGALRPAPGPEEAANLLATGRTPAARGLRGPARRDRGRRRGRPAPAAADAETRARLASLGYVAGQHAGRRQGPAKAGAARSQGHGRPLPALRAGQRPAHRRRPRGRGPGELEALVAADPGNPVFRGKLAEAWRERGETAKAVPLYRQAAEAAPARPRGLVQPGRGAPGGRAARTRRGRRSSAPCSSTPAGPRPTTRWGSSSWGRASSKRRGGSSRPRSELDPRNAAALNNLGNVLRGAGQAGRGGGRLPALRRARSALRRAAQRPRNAGGGARSAAGSTSLFRARSGLAPGYHEVRLNRAIAHDLAGDAAAALSAYRDFLAATAGDPRFAEQRRAAQQLLARLESRTRGERAGREEVIAASQPCRLPEVFVRVPFDRRIAF